MEPIRVRGTHGFMRPRRRRERCIRDGRPSSGGSPHLSWRSCLTFCSPQRARIRCARSVRVPGPCVELPIAPSPQAGRLGGVLGDLRACESAWKKDPGVPVSMPIDTCLGSPSGSRSTTRSAFELKALRWGVRRVGWTSAQQPQTGRAGLRGSPLAMRRLTRHRHRCPEGLAWQLPPPRQSAESRG